MLVCPAPFGFFLVIQLQLRYPVNRYSTPPHELASFSCVQPRTFWISQDYYTSTFLDGTGRSRQSLSELRSTVDSSLTLLASERCRKVVSHDLEDDTIIKVLGLCTHQVASAAVRDQMKSFRLNGHTVAACALMHGDELCKSGTILAAARGYLWNVHGNRSGSQFDGLLQSHRFWC